MIRDGIKRGSAQIAILSVLEDEPLHGYEIARRIELPTRGALRFTWASLYPLLYLMEKSGGCAVRGKRARVGAGGAVTGSPPRGEESLCLSAKSGRNSSMLYSN